MNTKMKAECVTSHQHLIIGLQNFYLLAQLNSNMEMGKLCADCQQEQSRSISWGVTAQRGPLSMQSAPFSPPAADVCEKLG